MDNCIIGRERSKVKTINMQGGEGRHYFQMIIKFMLLGRANYIYILRIIYNIYALTLPNLHTHIFLHIRK